VDDRAAMEWRRLDRPGHETAELQRTADGWRLSGIVTLVEASRPCRLDYAIECSAAWLTQRCVVHGTVGETPVRLEVARAATDEWTVDGVPAPSLAGCIDIDLGFTPATNLLPIRRLQLNIGARAPVRAAWVRFPQLTTEVLEQSCARLASDRYLYESANGAFRRELTVDAVGFVVEYPGIWIAETRAAASDRALGERLT
jgi:uncharacterized protein